MPIPTQTELSALVRNAVGIHLGTGAIEFEYRLWPQDPRVFGTLFEQDFCGRNDGAHHFGKILISQPTEDAEWGEVNFTISACNIAMENFDLHMLRLHKVRRILQSIRADMTAFRDS